MTDNWGRSIFGVGHDCWPSHPRNLNSHVMTIVGQAWKEISYSQNSGRFTPLERRKCSYNPQPGWLKNSFSLYIPVSFICKMKTVIFLLLLNQEVFGGWKWSCVLNAMQYIYAAQHKVMEGCFRTCSLIDRAGEAFGVEKTQQHPVLSIGEGWHHVLS